MSEFRDKMLFALAVGATVSVSMVVARWDEHRKAKNIAEAVVAAQRDAGGFTIGTSSATALWLEPMTVAPSTTNEVLVADGSKIRWMYEDKTLAWCEQPHGDSSGVTCATPVYCGECMPRDGGVP